MYRFILAILFVLTYATASPAQSSPAGLADPFANAVILSHYDSVDLETIRLSDSIKFNTIIYYYTSSFILETIPCNDCVDFDKTTFDVSRYENFRRNDERYTRTFEKYSFRLTLLSRNELTYQFPGGGE